MFKKFIAKLIVWVLVTAAFYGAAYVSWAFSPLISVGLALAHGYWHVRFTAVPSNQTVSVQPDNLDISPGPTADVGSVKYRIYRDDLDSLFD